MSRWSSRATPVVLVALLAACGPPASEEVAADAGLVEEGTLTACVAVTPRLVVATGDGGFEGYDVEALQAVGASLGLDLSFVETGFDDLVSGTAVNDGRCDIGAAGIVAAGDLDALVDVTAPYRRVDRLVVARAGTTPTSLDEARVGVEESGPAADAIDALDVGEVVLAPSLADLLRFLVVGEVDAVLVPSTEVPTVVEAVGEVTTLERVPTGDSTVMVMSRGSDEALTALVDEALTAFVDGPQGDGAADRWLGG